MTAPILKQIAELPDLPQDRLKALCLEYFGEEPPSYRKGFLVHGIAHRIQELTYGGLSSGHREKLEALVAGDGAIGRRKGEQLLAGTRLMREWKGVEHYVTVLADGFEYQGRPYKSLSPIARAITGTRWNGPLFFGLRKHGPHP